MKSLFTSAFLAALFPSPPLEAQEVIPAAKITLGLSDRGVTFQQLDSGLMSHMEKVIGVGDVDGDGFGDLLFATRDPCPSAAAHIQVAILYLGRAGLAGKVDITCDAPRTATFRPTTKQLSTQLGQGAAPAGDLNQDGLADFMFAYIDFSDVPGEFGPGEAFLVYGSKDLKEEQFVEDIGESIPGVKFWSSDPDTRGIGYSLASISDFNGDGKADLALGAPWSKVDDVQETGRVFIILNATALPSKLDLSQVGITIPGTQVLGARFPALYPEQEGPIVGEAIGYEVRAAGDVDGDGFADVLLKSISPASDEKYRGRHYLIRGSAHPPPVIDLMEIVNGKDLPGITLIVGPIQSAEAFVGAGIGDMNGDGFADVLFGAPPLYKDIFHPYHATAYLLFGGRDWPSKITVADFPASSRVMFLEPADEIHFANSVAAGGDMSGDGVPDLLVGGTNGAYAIDGRRDFGPEVDLAGGFSGIQLIGESEGEGFVGVGAAGGVNSAGDFNGDGALDFVARSFVTIADPNIDGTWARAYLIYGTGGKPQPLRLDRLNPAFGPVKGGTTVDLWGQGFSQAMDVQFGKARAEAFQFISQNRIQVRTPPGEAPDFVDVTVSSGLESKRLDFGFEYTPNFPEVDIDRLGSGGLVIDGHIHDNLGYSAAIGDITGDGVDDLILGMFPGRGGRGVIAYVVKGSTHLPETLPFAQPADGTMTFSIDVSTGEFVPTPFVSFLGDVNGDSIGDLGIAQPIGPGSIIFGGPALEKDMDLRTLLDSGKGVRIIPAIGALGNYRMVPAGDLNGDGIEDFAIGRGQEPDFQGSDQGAGEVLFVRGRLAWPREVRLGEPGEVISRIIGSRADQGLGAGLKAVGDMNGDGLPDFLASAQSSLDPNNDALAYLIYGSDQLPEFDDVESVVRRGGGMAIRPPRPLPVGNFSNLFNFSAAGDVNGDHYADLLFSQMNLANTHGISYLVLGGPQLPALIEFDEEAPAQWDGVVRIVGAAYQRFAGMISPAGDFNDDGFADFLIGESPGPDSPGDKGNVFLMLGRKAFPERIDLANLGSLGIRIPHGQDPNYTLTGRLGPFGDLNGDGQTDFTFSDTYALVDPAPTEEHLFVVFGPYGQKKFIRGDANSDGQLDISDAVTILTYLYSGGEKPTCIDALDTDDSGLLDITDAIYLLNFLYTAGPSPRDPYPNPGNDTTRDVLDCLGFNP